MQGVFLKPEDGTDRLSQNVGEKLPLLAKYQEERSSLKETCL